MPDDNKPNAKLRVVSGATISDDELRGRRFVRYYKTDEGSGDIYEQIAPRPLIGKEGHALDRTFLPLAGLNRDDVECVNVVRCGVTLPKLTETFTRRTIEHCQRAYWVEPNEQTRMVALGPAALWALTGEYEGDDDDADAADDDLRASKSIDGWRGWVLPYLPQWRDDIRSGASSRADARVFATYHISFGWKAHWLRPVMKMDWAKIGRWLRGTWPEPFPEINRTRNWWCATVAFDTEYNPWTKELHRYSVATRDDYDGEPLVTVVEAAEVTAWKAVPEVVIMQNAEADWSYMLNILGEPKRWHDTMLAHSLLYGTLRHSLDFMGSCYARNNRWKHLQKSDPLVYSGMDALATYDIWQQLQRELARDPQSMELYEEELKPLLPIVMARPSIRLNALHIAGAAQELAAEQKEIAKRGEAVAGWPLSISSADQVSRWLRLRTDA